MEVSGGGNEPLRSLTPGFQIWSKLYTPVTFSYLQTLKKIIPFMKSGVESCFFSLLKKKISFLHLFCFLFNNNGFTRLWWPISILFSFSLLSCSLCLILCFPTGFLVLFSFFYISQTLSFSWAFFTQ